MECGLDSPSRQSNEIFDNLSLRLSDDTDDEDSELNNENTDADKPLTNGFVEENQSLSPSQIINGLLYGDEEQQDDSTKMEVDEPPVVVVQKIDVENCPDSNMIPEPFNGEEVVIDTPDLDTRDKAVEPSKDELERGEDVQGEKPSTLIDETTTPDGEASRSGDEAPIVEKEVEQEDLESLRFSESADEPAPEKEPEIPQECQSMEVEQSEEQPLIAKDSSNETVLTDDTASENCPTSHVSEKVDPVDQPVPEVKPESSAEPNVDDKANDETQTKSDEPALDGAMNVDTADSKPEPESVVDTAASKDEHDESKTEPKPEVESKPESNNDSKVIPKCEAPVENENINGESKPEAVVVEDVEDNTRKGKRLVSVRGGIILIYEDHIYMRMKQLKSGEWHWLCQKKFCGGKLYTSDDQVTVVRAFATHNHPKDLEKITWMLELTKNGTGEPVLSGHEKENAEPKTSWKSVWMRELEKRGLDGGFNSKKRKSAPPAISSTSSVSNKKYKISNSVVNDGYDDNMDSTGFKGRSSSGSRFDENGLSSDQNGDLTDMEENLNRTRATMTYPITDISFLDFYFGNKERIEVNRQDLIHIVTSMIGSTVGTLSELGKMKTEGRRREEELEKLRMCYASLRKRFGESKRIIKKLIDEKIASKSWENVAPVRVTRSVNFQVCSVGSMFVRPKALFGSDALAHKVNMNLNNANSKVSYATKSTSQIPNEQVSASSTVNNNFPKMPQQAQQNNIIRKVADISLKQSADRIKTLNSTPSSKVVTSSNIRTGVPQRPNVSSVGIIKKEPIALSSEVVMSRVKPSAERTLISGPNVPKNSILVIESKHQQIKFPVFPESTRVTSQPTARKGTTASNLLRNITPRPSDPEKKAEKRPLPQQSSVSSSSLIIDLTDKEDEAPEASTDSTSKSYQIHLSTAVKDTISQPKTSNPETAATTPPVTESLISSFAELPPLPASPSNSSSAVNVPPQPILAVVKNTPGGGIMLSWYFSGNSVYEKIKKFQVYACQDSKNSKPDPDSVVNSTSWKNVGEVDSLPLPMACTLTNFKGGCTYHFAVRAVDIHNRVGKFSIPSSVKLDKK